MKKLGILILLLLVSSWVQAQEENYEVISYHQFLELIQAEEDSVFSLSKTIVEYNETTDSLFVVYFIQADSVFSFSNVPEIRISKAVHLNDVHLISDNRNNGVQLDGKIYSKIEGVLFNWIFEKEVRLEKCKELAIYNSTFEGKASLLNENLPLEQPRNLSNRNFQSIDFSNNTFKERMIARSSWEGEDSPNYLFINNNTFLDIDPTRVYSTILDFSNYEWVSVQNNQFHTNSGTTLNFDRIEWIQIQENNFAENSMVDIKNQRGLNRLQFDQNQFKKYVLLQIDQLNGNIDWDQFQGKVIADEGFGPTITRMFTENRGIKSEDIWSDNFFNEYINSIRFQDNDAYIGEMAFRGKFYQHYKAKFDTEKANAVFVDRKNLETDRMAFLHKQNPSFKSYFTWKVNQFLKIFSAYGTEPARAIIFSVYVILAFGLIYLFFPNSWDKNGKNRIMNRYRFFTKYMNREAGMHEVYLEEQQGELLEAEDFKSYMLQAERHIPHFFIATAMPLYKWAISGTRLSSSLLKRVDIMKGTWQDLPAHQRFWKSILLIGAFILTIVYDLFIKVLNALMLSINTFTTLGFGEIPIKGLPRYLAIIQGFIGWFMLTIFSVSLISQLLN